MKKIILIFALTTNVVLSQYLSNPSFEIYQGIPPQQMTAFTTGYSSWDNWFVKCLGCCINNIPLWPPPTNCNGWYLPTFGTSDYFRTDSPQNNFYSVQIPTNFRGVQYPANGQAYTGIWMSKQPYIDQITNIKYLKQYREYLQTKLLLPLLKGAKYHVSFKVSLAENRIGLEPLHWTNKIGALFSPEQILRNNDFPPNGTEPIIASPQVIKNLQPNGWLDNTGGVDNNVWMTVDDYFTPDVDGLQYITIGNFDGIMNSANVDNYEKGKPVYIYYYIDDIQITQESTPPCINCHSGIDVDITPHPGQSSENECCYDFSIKFKDLSNICPYYGIKISFLPDGYNAITKYQNSSPTPYQANQTIIIENICVTKNNAYQKSFNIEFLDENQETICSIPKTVSCVCDCGHINGMDNDEFVFQPEVTDPSSENCCWNIKLKNLTDCFLALKSVILSDNLLANDIITNESWSGYSLSPQTRYYWENPSSFVAPHSEVIVGKICIPSDGVTHYIDLIPTEWELGVYDQTGDFCAFHDPFPLKCVNGGTAINCCEDIKVNLVAAQVQLDQNNNPISDGINRCCWYLNMSNTYNTDCLITKIVITNAVTNQLLETIQNPQRQDGTYPPLDLLSLSGTREYCAEIDNSVTPPTAGVKLLIKFYGPSGLICPKNVEATCGNDDPSHHMDKRPDFDLMEDKKPETSVVTDKLGFIDQILPNPFNDNTVIKFRLNKEGDVQLLLKDMSGKDVKKLADGHFRKSNFVVTLFNEAYATGNYVCILLINGQVVDSKIIQMIK